MKDSFVYFFGARPHVKIGFTTDWHDRLRTIQTSSPHHIAPVVVIKGDRAKERELHERFAHLRCLPGRSSIFWGKSRISASIRGVCGYESWGQHTQ
jgi:hypothetical protein